MAKRNDYYRYQMMPLIPELKKKPLELDGKQYKFGKKQDAFVLKDGGVARALEEKYGSWALDKWEIKDQWHPADKGHKYTHQGTALPWHRECSQCGRKTDGGDLCQKCVERLEVADTAEKEGA